MNYLYFTTILLVLIQLVISFRDLYEVKCHILHHKEDEEHFQNEIKISGSLALFSPVKDFKLSYARLIYLSSKLCSEGDVNDNVNNFINDRNNHNHIRDENGIVLAIPRGECSFEQKATIADSLEIAALIVINNEDSAFPMGGSENFRSGIPCIMLPSSFNQNIRCSEEDGSIETCMNLLEEFDLYLTAEFNHSASMSLQGEPVDKVNISEYTDTAMKLLSLSQFIAMISIIVISSTVIYILLFDDNNNAYNDSIRKKKSRIASRNVRILTLIYCMLMIIFFFGCQVGTFRLDALLGPESAFTGYNHRETDEVVFDTLTTSLYENWSTNSSRKWFWNWDWKAYSLSDENRTRLGLADANYNDKIFHHPPIFTLFCILMRLLGATLPFNSLVLTALTAIFTVLIAEAADLGSSSLSLVLALALFYVSPLSFFCSQKNWIDVCLMMTSTSSVLFHIQCNKNCSGGSSGSREVFWNLISGIYFGLLVLNTKVTGLAILPCLLMWTSIVDVNELDENNKQEQVTQSFSVTSVHTSGQTLMKVIAVIIGACIGHSPWVLFYYSVTGKLLPSAWPSEELLRRSQFVRKAVEKPWYSYLHTICTITPLMACGLIIGGVCLLLAIYNIIIKKHDTRKIHENKELRRIWMPLYRLGILVLWPLGYILGHTLLAALGAGTQTRFILAAVPGCAIIIAIGIDKASKSQLFPIVYAPLFLLLFIQVIHCFYYGILYPSLHADVDMSIYDIISLILKSPVHIPSTKDSFLETGMYMKHFGLNLLHM